MYETMKKPNGYAILRNLYLNWLIQHKMQRFLFRFLRISMWYLIHWSPDFYEIFLLEQRLVSNFVTQFCNIKKNVNPFVPNAPFLYLLKTSEKLTVLWCFQGKEKGCIGNEWVNKVFVRHFQKCVCSIETSEAYSKISQTSKMELFTKTQPLTLFGKSSILDVWLVFECTTESGKKKVWT